MQPAKQRLITEKTLYLLHLTIVKLIKAVKTEIEKIKSHFGDFAKPVLFFSDTKNFRKKFPQNTKVIEIEKSPADTNVS